MIVSEGLTVNKGFCCVFRMEAESMEIDISISGFLVQCDAKIPML